MGIMIVPMAEKQVEGAEFNTDGKYLVHLIEGDLKALAESLGVMPLSRAVLDIDVCDESLAVATTPEEKARIEAETYKPVKEVLRSVRALKAAIAADPTHLSDWRWYDDKNGQRAIAELQSLEDWLLAIGEDNRFYLIYA